MTNHHQPMPPEDDDAALRQIADRLQRAGAPFRDREIPTSRFVVQLHELARRDRTRPSSTPSHKESHIMRPSSMATPSGDIRPRRTWLVPVAATLLFVVLSAMIFTVLAHRGSPPQVGGAKPTPFPTGTITVTSTIVSPPLTSAPVKDYQAFSTGTYQPGQVITDQQGNIWSEGYDAFAPNQIREDLARTTPAGVTTVFPIPDTTSSTFPGQEVDLLRRLSPLVFDQRGDIWFIHSVFDAAQNTFVYSLGRMNPTGQFTFLPVPSFGSGNFGVDSLTLAPDSNLWFTANDYGDHKNPGIRRIGRMTLTGKLTWFTLPAMSQTVSIITGPDGYLWFATNGAIERLALDGTITTTYPINGGVDSSCIACGANSLVFSGEHTLWFADFAPPSRQPLARIGRLDLVSRTVTYYTLPRTDNPNSFLRLFTIALTSDKGVWFNTQLGGGYTDLLHKRQFYHLLPNGTLVTEQLPTKVITGESVFAPDGKLWFGSAKLDSANQYHFSIAHITP